MGTWPRGELKQDLLRLARMSRPGAAGSHPLKSLPERRTLLSVTPAVLLKDAAAGNDARAEATATLLEAVASRVSSPEKDSVKAFGDLLGLTDDRSNEEIRGIYDRFQGQGKPKSFVRYGLNIRRILTGHRFGGSDTKVGLGIAWVKLNEEYLAGAFVDELCDYLDDKDSKLTVLAAELGYLPNEGSQPAETLLEPEPIRAQVDDTSPLHIAPTVSPDLQPIIRDLADAVRAQLQEEERQRHISDPIPMPVRWCAAAPYLADQWKNIYRVREDADPVLLDDTIDNIADVFEAVPSRRLVVLGRGGAGKTTLATELALALLAPQRRASVAAPVPVIFQLASWNPVLQPSLDEWLIEQLIADYDALKMTTKGKRTLAAQLVTGRHIIPILDGFDEIAPELRAEGIRKLNTSRDHGDELVLTSRPREYVDALIHASSVLRYAAVIELEDLALDDLVDYLPRTARTLEQDQKLEEDSVNRTKWDPVLASMRSASEDAHGAMLLEMLSTPLMVSLARSIYSETPADPAELLDSDHFADARTLSDHLFDQFVQVAYEHPPLDRLHNKRNQSWQLGKPRRWLAFLAADLASAGRRDIVWWTIRVKRHSFTFILLAILLVLTGLIGTGIAVQILETDVLTTSFTGLACVMVAIGIILGEGSMPSRLSMRHNSTTGWIAAVHRSRKRVIFSLIFLDLVFLLPLAPGLVDGSPIVDSMRILITVGGVLPFLVVLWLLPVTVDLHQVSSPRSSLRNDRVAAATRGVLCSVLYGALILTCWIGYGQREWLAGIPILVAASVVSTLLASASGWWFVDCARLAAAGRLPWRAMRFFVDAHQRGILRQSGGVYQFRHDLLQDHLASQVRCNKNLALGDSTDQS